MAYHLDPISREAVHCRAGDACEVAARQDHYCNISEAVEARILIAS